MFVDTHLHARYTRDVPHAYRAHRVGQIAELALASRELQHPVVMLGDFNFGDDNPEHAILTGLTGLSDVAAELDTPSATVLRENPYRAYSRKPDRRVDYVFARDGGGTAVVPLRTRRVFDERLDLDGAPASCSNHAGVFAELELVPGAGRALAGPSPSAVSLASQFLSEGRHQAKQRRRAGVARHARPARLAPPSAAHRAPGRRFARADAGRGLLDSVRGAGTRGAAGLRSARRAPLAASRGPGRRLLGLRQGRSQPTPSRALRSARR